MGDPKCSLPRLGVSLSSWILHEPDIQVGDTTHMSYPSRHEGSGRLYDYFKRYKIKVCWPQRLRTTGHILIRSCPWPDFDRSRSFWFLNFCSFSELCSPVSLLILRTFQQPCQVSVLMELTKVTLGHVLPRFNIRSPGQYLFFGKGLAVLPRKNMANLSHHEHITEMAGHDLRD